MKANLYWKQLLKLHDSHVESMTLYLKRLTIATARTHMHAHLPSAEIVLQRSDNAALDVNGKNRRHKINEM